MSRAAAVRLAAALALVALVTTVARALRGGPSPAFEAPPAVEPGMLGSGGAPAAAPAGASEAVPGSGSVDTAPNPPGQRWVFPVDGSCPPSHPIKAKLRSGLYHLPGMFAYERTNPDRCYATEVDARADGLRRAKR